MTAIGDALEKVGLRVDNVVDSSEKIKIAVETKIGYMKKHIENIQRLIEKFYRIQGDEQEEADIVSALNNHFIYMAEAFKDIIDCIKKQEEESSVSGLREAVRYFGRITGDQIDGTVNDALETFIDRNDLAHRYELYETISQKTLRNCISYSQEYMQICKLIYQYCKEHGMIKLE